MNTDSEIMQCHIVGVDRLQLRALSEKYHPTMWQWMKLQKWRLQSRWGMPLPYLINIKEFFGHSFFVNHHTLIPRPETECLIEEILAATSHLHDVTIVDIGTGSGCIAISCAHARPDATIIGIDVSKQALKIAQKNATIHNIATQWMCGDLLQPLLPIAKKHTPYIFVANLPYIPTTEYNTLPRHIKKFEPKIALHGGNKGTEIYERLFSQLRAITSPWILGIEIMPKQEKILIPIADALWPQSKITCKNDLAGLPRVILINQL